MDVTMTFSAIFRSRSTYYQLCTTLGAPEHVPNTSQRRPYGPGGITTLANVSRTHPEDVRLAQGVLLPWGYYYFDATLA